MKELLLFSTLSLFTVSAHSQNPLSLTGISLPDSVSYEMGRQVRLRNQTIDIKISEVRIVPNTNQLTVSVDIHPLIVNIPLITIQKSRRRGGRSRTVNCYHSRVAVGLNKAVPLKVTVPVYVNRGELQLGALDVDFSIPPSDFMGSGPQSCRGELLPRPLIRKFVENSIRSSRPDVEKTVREAISKLTTRTLLAAYPAYLQN